MKEPSPTHPSWGEVDCLQALGEAAAVHGKSLSSKKKIEVDVFTPCMNAGSKASKVKRDIGISVNFLV